MPVMDGLDATKEIRKHEKLTNSTIHLPIVALTAGVFQNEIQKIIDAGMDDILHKPINIEKLLDTLKKYIPSTQKINF